MENQKILICGAGIAGPTMAYWLQQFGFEPTLIERALMPPTIGAAMGFITSDPTPVSHRIGTRLAKIAATVIILGRKRWTAPSVAACSISERRRADPAASFVGRRLPIHLHVDIESLRDALGKDRSHFRHRTQNLLNARAQVLDAVQARAFYTLPLSPALC